MTAGTITTLEGHLTDAATLSRALALAIDGLELGDDPNAKEALQGLAAKVARSALDAKEAFIEAHKQ